MMRLVNVLVQIFCMKKPMNVVKAYFVNATISQEFENKNWKGWNFSRFLGHSVRRKMFNDPHQIFQKDRPNDVRIQCE